MKSNWLGEDSAECRRYVFDRLLAIGGLIAIPDGLLHLPEKPLIGSITLVSGVLSLFLVRYLRATSKFRLVVLVALGTHSIVFFSNVLLYRDPYYMALGSSVPLAGALFLGWRDALSVVIAYCLAGVGVCAALQFSSIQPAYDALPIFERGIAAGALICAMAIPTIWMQCLLVRTEREEHAQRHRFETICDSGMGALLEADGSGRVAFVRGKLVEKLGFEPDELLGRNQLDLVCPEDRRELLRFTKRDGETMRYSSELRVLDAVGKKRWIRLSGCTEKKPDGAVVFLNSLEDIESQVENREKLFELSRLESLGVLCGGLAHDFNNLLTVIGAHADALEDSKTGHEILKVQQQASDLTASLLAFAKKQTYREQDIQLNEFMNANRQMIYRLLPANIDCDWNIPDEPLWVRMDSAQLQQAVINLVTNAKQAMPNGGCVQISLSDNSCREIACDSIKLPARAWLRS